MAVKKAAKRVVKKWRLKAIAQDRLIEVAKHILIESKRFQMRVFARTYGHAYYDKRQFASCNTAACIGGWLVILDRSKDPSKFQAVVEEIDRKADWDARASKLLGLSRDQANKLFSVYRWPEQFRYRYSEDDMTDDPAIRQQNAEAAFDRIMYFIKTGK